MKVLSVDSSAVCASAAITEEGKIIASFSVNSGLTHSRTLLPMIDSVLSIAGTDLNAIDYFACSIGPGSFTGLRIGIAEIQGLADGTGKKCIPVSTLEGLAFNLKGNDCVACAVMDARCGQVYRAIFDIEGEKITRLKEDSALSIDELGKELHPFRKKVVFVGDGAELCHGKLGFELAPEILRFQNAGSVALAALNDFDEAKAVSPKDLQPVYLRLPQAERELRAKRVES